jgi:hypothetical protein
VDLGAAQRDTPDLAGAVGRASRRSNVAVAALALNGAVAVAGTVQALVGADETVVGAVEWGRIGALVLGAIAFLAWTHAAFTVAPRLVSSARLRQFPAGRVLSAFVVPLVNLVRPYYAFAALNEEVDPSDLLLPSARPHPGDIAGGYRDAAVAVIPARIPAPLAPVGWWWAAWIGRGVVSWALTAGHEPVSASIARMIVYFASDLPAALLAIVVVRRLDARLRERHRRMAYGNEPLDPESA